MPANPSQLAALSAEISSLANAAAPSVVAIEHNRRTISGFYLRSDVIATVSEGLQVQRDETVTIHTGAGEPSHGSVIGDDPSTDLVLVRVASPGVALAPAAPTNVALGQAIVAVGRTAFGATAALGFVALASGPWRSMRGGEISQRVWLDARVMRAAEGGPVIDTAGGLLGMSVFGPRRRVLLIPIDTIERAGADLRAHSRIRRGYIGVSVQPVPMPPAGADKTTSTGVGLMVIGLDAQGSAAAGGMLRGDIITAIDGVTPHSVRALSRLLPGSAIGHARRFDLVRAGQATHVTITIGEHPEQ